MAVRIILADTPGAVLGRAQTSPNLDLLYLASFARSRSSGLEFRYLPQSRPRDAHFQLAALWDPAIYFLSFNSLQAPTAYSLLQELKTLHPGMLIVAGGAHVNAVPEDVLRESGADACVIGEGEAAFAHLVDRLAQLPAAFSEIPGIFYRDGSTIRRTEGRPVQADLDQVPFPARDLVDPADYVGLSYRRARPNTEMIIARGTAPAEGRAIRLRSPQSIAEEAALLHRSGYREIYLRADGVDLPNDWSIEICKALAAVGRPDWLFQMDLPVQLSEELAGWLERARVWMVRFGTGRGLRGPDRDRLERASAVAAARGIRVFGSFQALRVREDGGRLESESIDEMEASLDFIKRLWKRGQLHYTAWSPPIERPAATAVQTDPSSRVRSVTAVECRRLLRQARWLEVRMALAGGGFEMRSWRSLLTRTMTGVISTGAPPAAPAIDPAQELVVRRLKKSIRMN